MVDTKSLLLCRLVFFVSNSSPYQEQYRVLGTPCINSNKLLPAGKRASSAPGWVHRVFILLIQYQHGFRWTGVSRYLCY